MDNKFIKIAKTAKDIATKQWKGLHNRKQVDVSDEQQKRILAELDEKGYCVIEGYYDADQCQALCDEIDSLIDRYADSIWRDDKDSDNRIFGAEHLSDLIRPFHDDPLFKQLADTYLKYETENMHTLANRVQSRASNLGSGGGWHRDTVNERQFKTIMYLNDVSETTGPFQYMPGTHTLVSPIKHIYQNNVEHKQTRFTEEDIENIKASGETVTTFTGQAGILIIVDTSGIHRGAPIQQGTRYALTNYIYPKHLINDRMRAKFKPLVVKPNS